MNNLFSQELKVISSGLHDFATNLQQEQVSVCEVDFAPTCNANQEDALALAKLMQSEKVKQANEIAAERYLNSNPCLEGVAIASEVIEGLQNTKRILHSGPPIAFEDMCGPMQGAICGAIVYEGWASDVDAAFELVKKGEVVTDACHHHSCVGPMAGIISPSMPVFIVKNKEYGNVSYSNFNEGLGKVLRFGANGSEVIDRLNFMRDVLYVALKEALKLCGSIEIKPLIAQALSMGDECHNRNAAATGLLLKILAPKLARVKDGDKALEFISANDHFFLNISMAACKCMLDAAANVKNSTMVVAMARNGVNFGIRVSGLADKWYQAPANFIKGLYFPGFSEADANPDLGDSAITETAGIGGFAMAAAPAIVKFVGGTTQDAVQNSINMQEICLKEHPSFNLPALNFAGSACCIDILKVLDRNVLPIINTGIAHKQAGVGQIGAGITNAPLDCFINALRDFKEE